jgi:hypothetical protein
MPVGLGTVQLKSRKLYKGKTELEHLIPDWKKWLESMSCNPRNRVYFGCGNFISLFSLAENRFINPDFLDFNGAPHRLLRLLGNVSVGPAGLWRAG